VETDDYPAIDFLLVDGLLTAVEGESLGFAGMEGRLAGSFCLEAVEELVVGRKGEPAVVDLPWLTSATLYC
jgi:hypothetical protein